VCSLQELVGYQAAIAGKPAPTGLRAVCKNWSAFRPPSLASQLPQRLRAVCKNWSAVRPPSLASLLPQDCVRLQELVGCQAAIAGKPAPTELACSLQELVGSQAAIAGKPAPTGLRAVCKNWSAIRPPSPAGWLPQKAKTARIRFSPLNTMSVSSSTAFDLDPRATSGG